MSSAIENNNQDTHQNNDGLAARIAVYDLLDHVTNRKQTLNSGMDRINSFKALPAQDRAFCRMMVATCLRRLGQIDDLITRAQDRPGSDTLILRQILRIGVTQLLFMDVPDHAAVDTSVKLASHMRMDRKKGFINAVLRAITREGKSWMEKQDETRINTPEWLLKLWVADYGLSGAAMLGKAHLNEAPLDISIKDEAERNHWASTFKASEIGCGTLRTSGGGAVSEFPGFNEGAWWVQDVSAAIPAKLFGDINGKTVADICAAPGGKTMQLAAQGANVIALDRSATRLKTLRENVARVGLSEKVTVEATDAATWKPREPIDHILLDAPCSATGTIRRHPDNPYLKSDRDIESLVQVQERILIHAFSILPVGGTLIYCVCSLQKCEGEAQIARFVSHNHNVAKIAITAEEIGGMEECITENGDVRTLPHYRESSGGMDGFFIARLTKTSP